MLCIKLRAAAATTNLFQNLLLPLQEQKEGLLRRADEIRTPSGDSARRSADNILAPFTQNSLDLSPLLRYNYIEIFI